MCENIKHISLIAMFLTKVLIIDSARILAFIPTASISHQVVLRPLTQELARRGHEVIVITTDPAFTKENAPKNLIEIDVHDVAYTTMKQGFAETVTGNSNDIYNQIKSFAKIIQNTFEAEINSNAVKTIINSKEHFDVLILEACVKPVLIFSHIFKAPVILFSSMPTYEGINDYTGTVSHPLLFPSFVRQRINNLTMWEKFKEIYIHYYFESLIAGEATEMGDKMLKRNFGNDIPSLRKLSENVDMVFLAEYHIWDSNRPVPPNVIYVGGIYPPQHYSSELPQNLKSYLDSSLRGVIYMSLGTNIKTSLFQQETVEILAKVFSKLQYNILLRWHDAESLFENITNVKIVRWLPQANLLKHPQVKLFISQGGLQSIEDAINAGVPLIGMPMLADQWFNVEQCVRLKIGLRLDIESVSEESMISAIKIAINDKSYRDSIVAFRDKVKDQPQTALERAVWWTEYVIRHKGASHLRSSAALISKWDYYEVDLIITLILCTILLTTVITGVIYSAYLGFSKFVTKNTKIKTC